VVYRHLRLHSSGGGFCQGVTNPPWVLGLEAFGRSPGPFNLQNHLSGTFPTHSGSRARCCPDTREAHRQARRIRRRHEDTGSSRNASHSAFKHASDKPTVDFRLVATVGRSLKFTGSAARMFLTRRSNRLCLGYTYTQSLSWYFTE
jgi:hypothetical protein